MMNKFSRIKNGSFLLLAVLVGVGIFCGIRSAVLEHQRMQLVDEINWYLDEDKFDVAIATMCDRDEMGMNSYVKWWQDEENGKFYFFLPSKWQKDSRAFWAFSNAEEIELNDRIIRNGDICDVKPGIYTMKVYDVEYLVEVMYSSDIASLFIETESGTLEFIHQDKEYVEEAEYILFDERGSLNNYGHIAEFSGRGNVTFKFVEGKKPYHMELQEKSQILGMGEEKDWILLANYYDHTLSRNALVYNMADELGLAYAPDAEYVDLYINGEYRGNYQLSEKVEVGNDRVKIRDLKDETEMLNPELDMSICEQVVEDPDKLFSRKWWKVPAEPENYTGGYLLEVEWSDRYGADSSGFITSRMQAVVVHNPKYATLNQIGYIADIYQDFEDAIYSEDGYNENTGKYFYEYIDMQSFATKYMIEELVKNLDASSTSCYFYKPEYDTKMYAGPVWDYDLSMGIDRMTDVGINLKEPEGLYVAVEKKESDIWYALYQQPYFREYIDELNKNVFENTVHTFVDEFIEKNTETIVESALMDDVLWDRLDGESIEERKQDFYAYNMEVKDFLLSRLDYLSKEWQYTK